MIYLDNVAQVCKNRITDLRHTKGGWKLRIDDWRIVIDILQYYYKLETWVLISQSVLSLNVKIEWFIFWRQCLHMEYGQC